jgi:hypothetical protein
MSVPPKPGADLTPSVCQRATPGACATPGLHRGRGRREMDSATTAHSVVSVFSHEAEPPSRPPRNRYCELTKVSRPQPLLPPSRTGRRRAVQAQQRDVVGGIGVQQLGATTELADGVLVEIPGAAGGGLDEPVRGHVARDALAVDAMCGGKEIRNLRAAIGVVEQGAGLGRGRPGAVTRRSVLGPGNRSRVGWLEFHANHASYCPPPRPSPAGGGGRQATASDISHARA